MFCLPFLSPSLICSCRDQLGLRSGRLLLREGVGGWEIQAGDRGVALGGGEAALWCVSELSGNHLSTSCPHKFRLRQAPPPTPSPRTAKMKKLASSPRNTSAAEMEGELSSFLHLCFTQGKNQHRVPGRGVWPRPCAGCELPSQHPHTPHPPQLPRQLLALDGAFRENKGRNATTWS